MMQQQYQRLGELYFFSEQTTRRSACITGPNPKPHSPNCAVFHSPNCAGFHRQRLAFAGSHASLPQRYFRCRVRRCRRQRLPRCCRVSGVGANGCPGVRCRRQRLPRCGLHSGLEGGMLRQVVWRWCHPCQSATEMTHVVLVVAITAQWNHLSVQPVFVWQSCGRLAIIAKPARLEPAVHAWTMQHVGCACCEDLHANAWLMPSATCASWYTWWLATNGDKQNKTKPNKTKQNQTKQHQTKPDQAKPNQGPLTWPE